MVQVRMIDDDKILKPPPKQVYTMPPVVAHYSKQIWAEFLNRPLDMGALPSEEEIQKIREKIIKEAPPSIISEEIKKTIKEASKEVETVEA